MLNKSISLNSLKSKLFHHSNNNLNFSHKLPQRQKLQYDILIIGAGISGLSTAIKLKQLQQKYNRTLSICILQKSQKIGDHILSGNCLEIKSFQQLYPQWKIMSNPPPIITQVTSDNYYFLTNQNTGIKIPNWILSNKMKNYGNYIISLSQLTKWMGNQAESLGIDIFTGTPASELIEDQTGIIIGVATQDSGIGKNGEIKENFQRGIEIIAKQTVIAQGCRGSIAQKVIEKYNLRENKDPQSYGIGLKQVWQINSNNPLKQPGYVQHTFGWPLDRNTIGGTFLYQMQPNIIHIGMVISLNYSNPYINPYEQFQRFKLHPKIKHFLKNAQCISYGARALNSSSYFSIPKLIFPGGILVGCSAGFMNSLKIKGTHTAIKSAIQAANSLYQQIVFLHNNKIYKQNKILKQYQIKMQNSWVWQQLYQVRNFKNSFFNIYTGLFYGGLFKFIQGKQPWNLHNKFKDSQRIQLKQKYQPIQYPQHDRKLTFDLLDNLNRSGTNHSHDQPIHLVIKSNALMIPQQSYNNYSAPQQKFCPAKVYQFITNQSTGKNQLQINAQNCLHCKTCSIKMIEQYIEWKTPQGNGGPKYNFM